MNCIIIDDEPRALDILESFINKTGFIDLQAQVQGTCSGIGIYFKQQT